jgi:hypothetical protein
VRRAAPARLAALALAVSCAGQPKGGEKGTEARVGPPVAAALDAKSTIALAAVSAKDLPAFLRRQLEELAPPSDGNPELAAVKSPADRKAKLGFDPLDAAGWAEIGIDPAGGGAVVLDERVVGGRQAQARPLPILLVRVTDRARVLAWIARRNVKLTIGEKAGANELVREGDRVGLVGARGDYTALVVPMLRGDAELDVIRAGFDRFLAGGGPALPTSPSFRAALPTQPPGDVALTLYGSLRMRLPVGQTSLGACARETALVAQGMPGTL